MKDAIQNDGLWFVEFGSPHDALFQRVESVIVSQKTPYQQLLVVQTGAYGKALILDGRWQSSTVDEFLYHEALVHPACVLHGKPQRALVLGGGEGATLREILKWKSVRQVTMVDIDREVVEICRRHLPELHRGAFDDPRTELVFADARDYLSAPAAEWDLIVSDLTDPLESGPAFKLFTREFFETCRRALRPGGILVLQGGLTAPPEMGIYVKVVNTLKTVFSSVHPYTSAVPTWGSPIGLALCSDSPLDAAVEPQRVDALLAEATDAEFRMFDGCALRGLLHPPKHLRDAIQRETVVYTLQDPPKGA